MLTYATILIASLILAVVALFLYNVISDSSRSVYSSKDRIAIIDRHPVEQKGKASHSAVTNTLNSVDRSGGVTRRNTANTVPAMPVDSSERGKQVPGQPAHRGAGVAHASHCSLYDVSAAKPEGKHNQNTGWPHREERREPGGKVYKVKRTSARKPPAGPKSINAPWGW